MQVSLGPLDYDFAVEQIIATIKSLKLNKANFGLVSNEILRCNPEPIVLPFCLMFNNILQSKVFPSAWNLSEEYAFLITCPSSLQLFYTKGYKSGVKQSTFYLKNHWDLEKDYNRRWNFRSDYHTR